LAPGFRSDLFDPKSQNHRNSGPISRILRVRIGRRWPEDGMRKCEVIFARALSSCPSRNSRFSDAWRFAIQTTGTDACQKRVLSVPDNSILIKPFCLSRRFDRLSILPFGPMRGGFMCQVSCFRRAGAPSPRKRLRCPPRVSELKAGTPETCRSGEEIPSEAKLKRGIPAECEKTT